MASRNSVGAAECALCLCIYEDPRFLPVCGHSFCLKCIKKSAKSNSLEVDCPLCRKPSSVTSGDFEGLPINYALISLLANLSFDSTKDFGANVDNVLCSNHKDEELVIVCTDCWMSLCVKCHEEAHSKHHMSSVRKFVADTIKKFQSDGKEIDLKLSQLENQKDKLEGNKAEFLNQIIEQEIAITKEYESLKLLLEQEGSKLLEELMMIKQSVFKNIEQQNQEFEFQCQELRSLNTRIHEMTKVTGAQVNMDAVTQLKEIKERLNNATNTEIELEGSKSVVKFLPTNLQCLIKKSSTENRNVIGKLQLNPISKKNRDQREEEPFDSAEFTIPPMFITSQYDLEEKLREFANDAVVVLNPNKSITLIADSYVDGLNAVQRILASEQETELRNSPKSESVKPKPTAATLGIEPSHNGTEHNDEQGRNSGKAKRNRHMVKDLTPQTNPSSDASQAVNRRSFSQTMTVDDHLWHYIMFKHADKVGDICARNVCEAKVVSEFSKRGLSYFLQVSPILDEKSDVSFAVNSVENAIEEFAQLFQKLSNPGIMEENVKLPPEMDKTELDDLRKAVDRMEFLMTPNDLHRLVGPQSQLKEAKDTVWKVISEHQTKIQSAIKKDTEKDKPLKFQSAVDSKRSMPDPFTGSFHTSNGLAVFVSQGNLVQQLVDAIVNPANCHLEHASGAARAISKAAGRRLNEESRDYIKTYGPLKTTWVTHTSAGNLQPRIRYVIHAVGPRKTDHTTNEILFQEVKRTIYNCLDYANRVLKIQSIAVPAISSGLFGVPLKTVPEASFAALEEFDNSLLIGQKVLRDIHFLNIDEATVSCMKSTFAAALQQKNSGSYVGPDSLIDKDDVFDRYAAVFGRERTPVTPDEHCFSRAIATALQKDLGRKVDFRNVCEQIRNEIKSNVLYKKFQPDSFIDWLKNAFMSPAPESQHKHADLLLSAAANAFKVEIVLVELDESFELAERNFKPEASYSGKSFDSIYISRSFRGHPHFDALTKVSTYHVTDSPISKYLAV